MLFGDFDWNRVLMNGLIGGVIGAVLGLVVFLGKKMTGGSKRDTDELKEDRGDRLDRL